MTLDQLTTNLLNRIRADFYRGDVGGFMRDRRNLVKAIARYGTICHQRGWELTPEFIQADILRVLASFRARRDEIEYLPVYLQQAIDLHCRQKAEELREAALKARVPSAITKVLNSAQQVEAIRTVGACEALAAIEKGLKTGRPKKVKTPKPAKEPDLFA